MLLHNFTFLQLDYSAQFFFFSSAFLCMPSMASQHCLPSMASQHCFAWKNHTSKLINQQVLILGGEITKSLFIIILLLGGGG